MAFSLPDSFRLLSLHFPRSFLPPSKNKHKKSTSDFSKVPVNNVSLPSITYAVPLFAHKCPSFPPSYDLTYHNKICNN